MPRGELFILSAPSGAGKTTLIQRTFADRSIGPGTIAFSVSHTTRAPRAGEVDGKDYHFIDASAFQSMIVEDRFLEWAQVHNNYYGTSLGEVMPRLEAGVDVVLDIDVQGAERVMSRMPEAHSIFVMPPSYEDLRERLIQRGLDGVEEITRRLAVSQWEVRQYDRYKYVIVNDDAERASRELAAIVLDKRLRRERMAERAAALLAGFKPQS